jgi:maltooligosyltrehalose trehalohydrolase
LNERQPDAFGRFPALAAKTNKESIWRLEFGARPTDDGILCRVWAPSAQRIAVRLTHPHENTYPMTRGEDDIFSTLIPGLAAGAEYLFELDGNRSRPDPVSRLQPHGVHTPSRVIDPDAFEWTDAHWRGLPIEQLVIYELHTGTFTAGGTLPAIIDRLRYLRDVGITAVELMPVATFAGARNWGYDGAYLYAPHPVYGGPDGLKRFVDSCHREGLAVVLDVVYNHLGPEGNYLGEYGPYFTAHYRTPWGHAINFDGPLSDGVRRFFIDNALYWLTEYHIDALRLDAVHGIYDFGARHVLHELANAFHEQARALGRCAYLIAESDLNDTRIINPANIGGYGLDAQWSDDFHHALHTILTGSRRGYLNDFGRIEDLREAIVEGYVYNGRYSNFRRRRHGVSSSLNPGRQFVIFNQNHDQIANACAGTRLSGLAVPAQQRLAMALLICAPNLPMLFMGEEFAASSPFHYFTSFSDPALAHAVSEGRKREYEDFFRDRPFPDPQSPDTFAISRIDWREPERSPHREMLELTRALTSIRKKTSSLSNCRKDLTRAEFSEAARWLVIERADPSGPAAFVFCNLREISQHIPLPRRALGATLALFTEETRFSGRSDISSPRALLGSADGSVALPPFSAALYLAQSACS